MKTRIPIIQAAGRSSMSQGYEPRRTKSAPRITSGQEWNRARELLSSFRDRQNLRADASGAGALRRPAVLSTRPPSIALPASTASSRTGCGAFCSSIVETLICRSARTSRSWTPTACSRHRMAMPAPSRMPSPIRACSTTRRGVGALLLRGPSGESGGSLLGDALPFRLHPPPGHGRDEAGSRSGPAGGATALWAEVGVRSATQSRRGTGTL